jgi:hypothetical protein
MIMINWCLSIKRRNYDLKADVVEALQAMKFKFKPDLLLRKQLEGPFFVVEQAFLGQDLAEDALDNSLEVPVHDSVNLLLDLDSDCKEDLEIADANGVEGIIFLLKFSLVKPEV